MVDPDRDTLSITLTSLKSTLAHNASMMLIFVLFLEQLLIPTLGPLHMFPFSGILFLLVFLGFLQFSV